MHSALPDTGQPAPSLREGEGGLLPYRAGYGRRKACRRARDRRQQQGRPVARAYIPGQPGGYSSQPPPRPPPEQPGRLIVPGQGGGGWGGGRGPSGGEDGASRLVVPGREGGGRQDGRGPAFGAGGSSKGHSLLDNAPPAERPVPTSYRPPPGFMDTTPQDLVVDDGGQSPQEMLERLRASAGTWHELARLLAPLGRAGYDAQAIEAEIGLERRQQNTWAVALQVYESLRRAPDVSDDALGYFDGEGGELTLYHLRNLVGPRRTRAAVYIAAERLESELAEVLARAVKEQERRSGEREGFSDASGDCLAFKYYRDAIETKVDKEKKALVEKGLGVAVTEEAKAALRELVEQRAAAAAAFPARTAALLQAVRLTREETGVRLLPLLAEPLGALTGAGLGAAPPPAQQAGAFNTLALGPDAARCSWLALPPWNAILLAKQPVGVSVPDCSKEDAIVESQGVKSEEEAARLGGQGLLVVERDGGDASPDSYYLVGGAGPGEPLRLVAGENVGAGAAVHGRVLFLCRPPVTKGSPLSETAELLQL